MTFKKALSLGLAVLMILSCMTVFASCKKNGSEDKIPKSKREHVYAESSLGIDEIPGYVNNIFSDGENIIMHYDVTYTVVRNNEGNEVERFEGYYYDYSGGVYEPIVYDYIASDAVIMYGTEEEMTDDETVDVSPTEENVEDVPEIDISPADIVPTEEPVIMPGIPGAEDGKLEGEPDEFGVITDENFNISVPEGWWIEYMSEEVFEKVPLNGGEASKYQLKLSDLVKEALENPEEAESGYCQNLFVGNDGKLRAVYATYVYDEVTYMSTNTYYIVTLDLDAEKAESVKRLNDCFVSAGLQEQETYINSIVMLSDGNYYFSADGGEVYVADGDMKFLRKIHVSDTYLSSFVPLGENLLVGGYDANYTKQTFSIIENGQVKPIDENGKMGDYVYQILGGSGSRIYYRLDNSICYYDCDTDEIGEEVNFLNSDIDYRNLNNLVYLGEGRMLMSTTDWSIGRGKTTVSLLTKVPDEEIKEEVIVTVGTIYEDYDLVSAIMKYNKQGTGVRIALKSYNKYNNEENEWTGATTQLNNEIISGSLPDIVMLESSLPSQSYFQKGVFVDLNKYLDDEEKGIDKTKYYDNILSAGETNGKLYSIITNFMLGTLVAKSKYVGEEPGWTFDEMMNAIKNMPEGMEAFYGMGREGILSSFLQYGMSGLVNWETGETKFDTPAFIEFIKYLATCPEKGLWEEYYDSMQGDEYIYDEEKERELEEKMNLRFWNDTCLFETTSVYSYTDQQYIYSQFASKDITFIGYPTDNENASGAVIVPMAEYAISSKSQVKDQAWDFIKFLLDSDDDSWTLSISKEKTAELKEQAKKQAEEMAKYGYYTSSYEWMKEMGYSDDYLNYQMNANMPLDDEMINSVDELLESANVVARVDSELTDIINEELSGFFAGTKSAEETARVIAGRAKIMISTKS